MLPGLITTTAGVFLRRFAGYLNEENPDVRIHDVEPYVAAKKAKNIMATAAGGRRRFLLAILELTNCES